MPMTSRERILLTVNHEEPDRVPIVFRSFGQMPPLRTRFCWRNQLERAVGLAKLGVDDLVRIRPPWPYHPDVRVRQWWERRPGHAYQLVTKEIDTPRGTLRLTVKETPDYISADLSLAADQNWPRGVEFPINGPDDLDKLAYVLYDPRQADLSGFIQEAQALKSFADTHGLPVEAEIFGLTRTIALLGPTRFLFAVKEDKEFLLALFEMIHDWDLKRLEVLLDLGVDIIYCSGCYECTELLSPSSIRELFFPFHRKTVEMIHQAGAKFHYYTITGIMPLLADYREMGFDILSSLDPWGSGGELKVKAVDLVTAKREIGDTVCLWGGVDPEHTIELGTQEDVRKAVQDAIYTCAPGGGFVLSLAGDIRQANACSQAVFDNLMTFIETGHEFGQYPIHQA